MSTRTLFIAAFALFTTAAAASAQQPSGRATLLQLSLANPDQAGAAARRTAMTAETARITSCRDALQLGNRLKARGLHGSLDVNVRNDVPLAALPAPLRTALLARPVGRATPIYGGATAFRVLIRCESSFKLPGEGAVPVPVQRRRPITI